MITDIRLQNFRSYKDVAFEFDKGVNIIVGPNTSGKTNLLEAVLVLARGSSFRGKLSELILHGKPWMRLDAHTVDGQRTMRLKQGMPAAKSFEINGKMYTRLPMAKTIPTVLFEPLHLLLLTGRPDLRRDYIDDLLEQTTLGYSASRRGYKRALYQRNSLLKKGPKTASLQLFAWNVRLSELGGQIATARHTLTNLLNQQITDLYRQLSGNKDEVTISYQSALPITEGYGSALLHKLETNTQIDFARGFTTFGPHRDDILLQINGHDAQNTASRGELRTILLALKLLELRELEKLRGQKPLLLLDDVFSELDGKRRRALTGFIKDYQTFITTTDADVVAHNFAQKCNVITAIKTL